MENCITKNFVTCAVRFDGSCDRPRQRESEGLGSTAASFRNGETLSCYKPNILGERMSDNSNDRMCTGTSSATTNVQYEWLWRLFHFIHKLTCSGVLAWVPLVCDVGVAVLLCLTFEVEVRLNDTGMVFKNTVFASKKTQHISTKKVSYLLFRELIAGYSKSHVKLINIVCRQNAQLRSGCKWYI
jgi:hypothetical protein